MDITKVAYERYRLHWLLDHGYSLTDLIKELDIMQEECPDYTVSQLFNDWEYGFGFGSEIWACYDEFMINEFFNEDVIKKLLKCSELKEYLEYIK